MKKDDNFEKQQIHQKHLSHKRKMQRKIAIATTLSNLSIEQKLRNYEQGLLIEISNDQNGIFDFERLIIFQNLIALRHKSLEVVTQTPNIKKIVFGKNPIYQDKVYSIKINSKSEQLNHFSVNFPHYFENQQVNRILEFIFARRFLFKAGKFVRLIEDFAEIPRMGFSMTDLGSRFGIFIKVTADFHRLCVGDVLILPSCHQITVEEIIHKRNLMIKSEKLHNEVEVCVLSNANIDHEKMIFKGKIEQVKEIWTSKGSLRNPKEVKFLDDLFEIENSFDFLIFQIEGAELFEIQRFGFLVVNDLSFKFSSAFFPIEIRNSQFLIHKEDFYNILWKLIAPFGKNKHVPTEIGLKSGDELMIEGAVLKIEELKN